LGIFSIIAIIPTNGRVNRGNHHREPAGAESRYGVLVEDGPGGTVVEQKTCMKGLLLDGGVIQR